MVAAFEVYNDLGFGMAEEVYESAFEVEPGLRDIGFVTEVEFTSSSREISQMQSTDPT